jgi:hypothetical protein
MDLHQPGPVPIGAGLVFCCFLTVQTTWGVLLLGSDKARRPIVPAKISKIFRRDKSAANPSNFIQIQHFSSSSI